MLCAAVCSPVRFGDCYIYFSPFSTDLQPFLRPVFGRMKRQARASIAVRGVSGMGGHPSLQEFLFVAVKTERHEAAGSSWSNINMFGANTLGATAPPRWRVHHHMPAGAHLKCRNFLIPIRLRAL
jgi:hypothetical protein